MSIHIDYAKGDTLPDYWLDKIQEVMLGGVWNLKLERASSTSVRIPASTQDDQAGIVIDGAFRFMDSSVTAAHPGGVAGVYDVWVTAAANNFTGLSPNIDLTNYDYGLTIKAQSYSWTGGDPALRRKIGYVQWDGAAIVDVRQLVGRPSQIWKGTTAGRPAAAAENEGLLYFATDSNGGTLFHSNGVAWSQVAPGVTQALLPAAHATTHAAAGTDALAWTTIHGVGTFAARPAAASTNNGYLYLATDTSGGTLYRSNGSTWAQVAMGVSGEQGVAQAILLYGLAANLPSPTTANRYFYYHATDTKFLYQNQSGSTWATIVAGTAGGDLSGTYPNPAVVQASGAFAFSGVQLSSITGDQDNFVITGAAMVRVTGNAVWTITGLAGGTSGRVVTFHNFGTFKVRFGDESANSIAANRFALGGDISIQADDCATFQYDVTSARWRCIAVTPTVVAIKPLYVIAIGGDSNIVPEAANEAILVPFQVVGSKVTINAIVVDINVVGGNIDVGIYTAAGVKVVSKGSIVCPPNGVNEITVTQTDLDPGNYYVAMASSSTTMRWNGEDRPIKRACRRIAAAFPLPSSLTVGTVRPGQNSGAPGVMIEVL